MLVLINSIYFNRKANLLMDHFLKYIGKMHYMYLFFKYDMYTYPSFEICISYATILIYYISSIRYKTLLRSDSNELERRTPWNVHAINDQLFKRFAKSRPWHINVKLSNGPFSEDNNWFFYFFKCEFEVNQIEIVILNH